MRELEILQFINHFLKTSKTQNFTEVFTQGCCYWFAYILCARFPEMEIMYDPTINHFMAGCDGRLFDVTGEVTDMYKNAVPWKTFDDSTHRERLNAQCIDFAG